MEKVGLILLAVIGVIAAVSLVTVGIMSVNEEIIDRDPSRNDCFIVTYEENRAFGKDENLSGIYCKD